MLRQTHVPVHVKLLESIVNDEASSAVNTAKADLAPNSANEALKGVLLQCGHVCSHRFRSKDSE